MASSSLSSSSVNPLESNGVLSAILSFQGSKVHEAQETTESLVSWLWCTVKLVLFECTYNNNPKHASKIAIPSAASLTSPPPPPTFQSQCHTQPSTHHHLHQVSSCAMAIANACSTLTTPSIKSRAYARGESLPNCSTRTGRPCTTSSSWMLRMLDSCTRLPKSSVSATPNRLGRRVCMYVLLRHLQQTRHSTASVNSECQLATLMWAAC